MKKRGLSYEQAIRVLDAHVIRLGGLRAAQASERWRGMAYMLATIYEYQLYNVLDDLKRLERRRNHDRH